MKQILYTIIVCIISYTQVFASSVIFLVGGVGSATPPTYILEETFSGTTTPSGWTDTGTPDYSTDGTVVMDFGDNTVPPSWTSKTTLYCAIKINFGLLTTPNNTAFIQFNNTGGEVFRLYIRSTYQIRDSIDSLTTTATFSASTDYFFWIRYTAESSEGANDGILQLRYGTTGSYAASTLDISSSTYSVVDSIESVKLIHGTPDSNGDFIFYHIIVSDTAIGDITDA